MYERARRTTTYIERRIIIIILRSKNIGSVARVRASESNRNGDSRGQNTVYRFVLRHRRNLRSSRCRRV